ncbi:unnamed protein product, partial [Rotaria sp. Silwood2]
MQRTTIFLKCGVLAVPGSRCCRDHLCNDGVTFKSLSSIRISKADQWKIDSNEFQMFVEDVRAILFKQKTFDFDDETCFNDEGFQSIVGLTKEQFNQLAATLPSMRNSSTRSVRVAVAVFLAKLRLGLSNRVLAILFHLDNKRVVSHIISQVRKALINDFVPYHLGLQHISREIAIEEHQTNIASILHSNKPDQLIVIADTTYIFVQKSSNNQVQRKSYSMHKHRNLVKPMILTTTIICALINAFRPRPVSDIQAGSEVAYYMLEKFNQQNNIQLRLSEIAKERSGWKTYDASMCLFPELSQDDVRTLCC